MKYTVVWGKDAEQDLASIWLASQDRDQIAYAAHLLDEMLAENAERAGELCASRSPHRWQSNSRRCLRTAWRMCSPCGGSECTSLPC